ncbi:MAG: GspE/PulE family protein [Thermodesulfovibrionales bacterium]|nr:GspE/PulE family protein [Thermodesulfovibrionales bacterium]
MALVNTEKTADVQELQRQLQFNERLKFVAYKIHSANNINEILIKLKDAILNLFDAERITIYLVDPVKRELVSKYLVGTGIKEIRVPVSPASISGYTAYTSKILNISDVHNDEELKKIDPNLHFDKSWDQKSGFTTRHTLSAPIHFEGKLLGVIQLINKKHGPAFTKLDERSIIEIARVLGIAFRNQSKMIHTRFDHLVSVNIITEVELRNAVATAREQKKDIETVLMESYKVKKSDIGTSIGQFYGCKFIEYDNKVLIQRELLKGLNLAYLKKSLWLPMSFADGKAAILIDNPKDPKTLEIKSLIKAREYEFNVATKDDILKFIQNIETDVKESLGSITDILAEMDVKEEKAEADLGDGTVDENAGAIVRLVNQILIDGYEKGASDIHIEPSKAKKTTSVRFRIDGTCMKHLELPLSHSNAVVSRIKIMSNLDISERRLPQDGKIKFIYKDKPVELRVATLPTVGGEDVVMRILASSKPMTLDELNLSEANYKRFKEVISYPYGIVLVVGPTGSGKTTTLHSALGYINTPDRKIWTAEDPVEITQEGLRQVEVKPKIDFNFARAMRAFLRADPDVIMVGEMRDHETAAIGIEASLTGHLVFSTLHTNSAPETITRLIDMDIDPFNFADALLGILAQRLARTLCKKCKEPYNPSAEEFGSMAKAYGKEFPELGINYSDKLTLFRPKGCGDCNNTGYKGRLGIYELLTGTKEIKSVIAKGGSVVEIRAQAIEDGMRTLFQDGISKVFKGLTDFKQIRSVCMNQ